MANYYSDHPEIGFYLNHPLMARIVELKEKGTLPLTWAMPSRTTSRFLTSQATWLLTSSLLTQRASTWKGRTLRTDA